MSYCISSDASGNQCTNMPLAGEFACADHVWVNPNPPMMPLCEYYRPVGNESGRPCFQPVSFGKTLCKMHETLKQESERRVAEALLVEAITFVWDEGNVAAARRTLERANELGVLAGELYLEMLSHLETDIAAWEIRPPAPENRGILHNFAMDNQNVHTLIVSKMTNDGEEILLNTPVPAGQKTLAEIADQWHEKRDAEFSEVMRDMHAWYATTFCRKEGDCLYARMLDGLWALIKRSPHKADLTERLWDEAFEGVEMCCDGHIARLCNVMVGFDDAFKTPQSKGELLQQKMAAIAAKDISIGEKVTEAWPIFDEFGVPPKERRAWIDAF